MKLNYQDVKIYPLSFLRIFFLSILRTTLTVRKNYTSACLSFPGEIFTVEPIYLSVLLGEEGRGGGLKRSVFV